MKNVKTDLETIAFIADQNADRVRFFLGLNQKDADLLIEEIHSEQRVDSKVSKLLRLLVDRLSSFQRFNQSYITESQDSASSTENTPKNEELLKMKKKLESCNQELQQSLYKIEDLKRKDGQKNEDSNVINSLRYELENAKRDKQRQEELSKQQYEKLEVRYIHLKQKYLNAKDEQMKMQNDVDGLKQQLKKFSAVIKKLKSKMTDSASFSSQIVSADSSVLSDDHINPHSQDSIRIRDLERQNAKMNMKLQRKLAGLPSESESVEELEKEKEKFNEEIQRAKARNVQLSNTLQMETQKRKQLEDRVADLEVQNAELKKKIPSAELENKLREKTDRAERAEAQLNKIKKENQNLHTNYDTLFQTVSILRTEIASLTDERKKLLAQIDQHSKMTNEMNQNSLERDVYKLRYNDLVNSKTTTEKKLSETEEENKRLNREIIRLETQLAKTKDELYRANQKIQVFDQDALTLSRFGFMLADAVCSTYNPRNVECEIERLIEIVRSEHLAFVQSTRVPLDPLDPMNYQMDYHPTCPECGKPL